MVKTTCLSGRFAVYPYAAIVTLLTLLLYLWMGISVGRARARFGIHAPAMTGHPEFERHVRVQANTLEWLVVFLPCLWLFALYLNELAAAGLGLIWIIGRTLYMLGYRREPKARAAGFYIQGLATLALFLGAFGAAAWRLVQPV